MPIGSLHTADPSAGFVGREAERDALQQALADAVGGSGRVVLIGGEPGIGKTRLATVTAAAARARGVPVWWGDGWEDGTAPIFRPWNVALKSWMRQAGTPAAVRAAAQVGPELSHVFAALRDHTAGPAEAEWASDQARFRLFDTVGRFLAAVAEPAGLLIVLDDAHWADAPSLRLLEFIAHDIAQQPLLIVATYRDTEVQRGHPFFATLAALARQPATQRLNLVGLSAADCARYLALAGGGERLGGELHRETNGNPFFLGEIVRLLASESSAAEGWDPQALPPGVHAVVARRLDRLGSACRDALAVAALLGESFDASRLARVLAQSPAAPLRDRLERAQRDRILVAIDSPPDRYAFAHALIRRVLIDELEPSQRAAWHARIAATIEADGATGADAPAAELVRHFIAAGGADDLRKALAYARRGAEQAERGLGWEEAARLYELAVEVGQRGAMLDDAEAIELRLAAARALRFAGDVAGARTRCAAIADAARAAQRPDLLARAALVHAGPVPDFYRIDPETRAMLQEACRAAAGVDDSLTARLHARLAGDIIAANEIDEMERAVMLVDTAAAAARRAGDAGALALAQMGSFYLAALGTHIPATAVHLNAPPTLATLRDILAAAESAGELEFAAQIRHTRATAMFALDEAEGFWAEADALATVAAASRVPEALWLADAIAAMRATVEGRFEEGRRLSQQALATGRRMQIANAPGVFLGQEVMWHAAQGRLGELLPMLDESVGRHPNVAVWRCFRALARMAAGDAVAARAEYQALIAAGLAPAKRGVNLRSYLAGLAALCVGLRDREQAPILYRLIARRPEAWSVDGCSTLGPWPLALAALARLSGDRADAAARCHEAIRLGQRMRSRPAVAHAQMMLAALGLSGDADAAERRRAGELLDEAEHGARELGLAALAADIERLRAKHRGAATPPARNHLRRDGDVWSVQYEGTALHCKDARGMHYLAALLAAPGRELHVLQLAALGRGGAAPSAAAGELPVGGLGMLLDDGPDDRARKAYRARLDDLRGELEEAERLGDLGRSERLRTELELLLTEVGSRFGHGRRHGPAETARKAVTKALRTQIGRFLDVCPPLGRHLHESLRMGTVCVYAPSTPVDWET